MVFYTIAYGNNDDNRQGIFVLNFDEEEKGMKVLKFYTTLNKPASFVIKDKKMFLSSINVENKKGFISIINIENDLEWVEEKTYEQEYFYSHLALSKSGNYLLGASFYEGVDAVFSIENLVKPISKHIHTFRKRTDKPIQQATHSHYIGMTPDEKYIYSADIGTDEVFVYDFQHGIITLNKERTLDRPLGKGPRLMPFSNNENFAYLINELSNEVDVFSYKDGNFLEIQSISTLDKKFTGENTAAGIKISENSKYLAVTNRGEDSVVIYNIEETNGFLSLKSRIFTGKKPRDIAFVGDNYILVCTQDDNKIEVIEISEESHLLNSTVEIPCPVFII